MHYKELLQDLTGFEQRPAVLRLPSLATSSSCATSLCNLLLSLARFCVHFQGLLHDLS